MRQTTQDIVLARLRELGLRWRTGQPRGASHRDMGLVPAGRPADEAGPNDAPAHPADPRPDPASSAYSAPDVLALDRGPENGSTDPATVAGGGSDGVSVRREGREVTPWGCLIGLVAALAVTGAALAAFLAWPRFVSDQSATPISGVPTVRTAAPTATGDAAGSVPTDPFADPTQPAQSTVVVHVAGEVRHPGIVRLPAGSRVVDAVEAAGGLKRGGVWGGVNLARILSDGERVEVGSDVPAEGSVAGGAPPAGAEMGAPSAPLDLNTATAEQLDTLPGIGPVTATKILSWRSAHGRFSVVDELGEVSGIGPKTLEELRPHVRV